MFYKEDKVNQLIALMNEHDVGNVVLCPGSRNAVLVNNIVESGMFKCYPVTDERSAGFFALGLSLDEGLTAIVVTSGSALLNVAPAVVEAYYQHVPLIVISADRPQEDIDQNVGQTMRQYGALSNCVCRSVNLTDAMGDNMYYHNRLINEALFEMEEHEAPVHINVPLPEPSECKMVDKVNFNPGNVFKNCSPFRSDRGLDYVFDEFFGARRPMIVIGQDYASNLWQIDLEELKKHVVVLSEPLSDNNARPYDGIIGTMPDSMLPNLIIYVGGNTVCRSMYKRFAAVRGLRVWRVGLDGDFASPFKHLDGVIRCSPHLFFRLLADYIGRKKRVNRSSFYKEWEQAFAREQERLDSIGDDVLSAATTVKYFEEQLEDVDDFEVFYGNSTPVRLACQYARGHRIFCNRGVNGIEGCVSTAAGYSALGFGKAFCVVGDLSFFYDQNALWNSNLNGNLRIILLNDHHGGIFDKVKGLENCKERDRYIAGRHKADARGICTQNDVGYLSAKTVEEMHIGIVTLLTAESERPMVLEVELN